MYAKIEDGLIRKYPYTLTDLKKANPSTSFPKDPLNNNALRDFFDIVKVEEKSKPEYNSATHKCSEENPIFQSGIWSQVWETRPKTSKEKKSDDIIQWSAVRNERNQRLLRSDWRMVKALETGEDASDLRVYRQKLRDIPQTLTDPFSPNWPPEV